MAVVAPSSFQAATEHCTVLLVEDEAAVAALTSEMLQERGYEVVHVDNGHEGLKALGTGGPSIGLILSDVIMPGGLDGLSFFRELRSEGVQLPVVLVSGFAEAVRGDVERAGIVPLPKPYRVDELGRVLSGVLSRHHAHPGSLSFS